MKTTLISLGVALIVAVLVYLALPAKMYVETALNIIVLSFAGAGIATWILVRARGRRR
ncbi:MULTISPECIES: hypothetical protein [Massilia]|uniref:hypothetical protein n=1 Tax=Massilia TaxID=149698 RepID=UPI001C62D038|nr:MULTISPECIES: hypothetical protein [Massilia]QYG01163.1 hypothetical protein KY496_22950 [Massilia sp. NP310]